MIANIGSDDALILPHRANPAGLNFRERQVLNAEHLRRILAKYATYYNEVRTHVSLGKDAPCRRPVERFGDIVAYPVLGGLHHRYARI
jgi:transposase InsO family protein